MAIMVSCVRFLCFLLFFLKKIYGLSEPSFEAFFQKYWFALESCYLPVPPFPQGITISLPLHSMFILFHLFKPLNMIT